MGIMQIFVGCIWQIILKKKNKQFEMGAVDLGSVIERSLEDDKAQDIVTIDLHGKTDIADYMVIATGRSSRHVTSIAENLLKHVKDAGFTHYSIEGAQTGDWVLFDAMDVIVHIFKPDVRTHYNLEKMWSLPVTDEK